MLLHMNNIKAANEISEVTPRTRARARHIIDNYYIGPSSNKETLEIWAYTDKFSFNPGEKLGLRVSTTAETWEFEIGRDGSNYETMMTVKDLQGVFQDTPDNCSVIGCNWSVSHEVCIPNNWRPGTYLITLRGHSANETVEEHHIFILRRSIDSKPAPRLLVCATGTWVAYNCWGGSNAYEGICGPDRNQFSPVLSTQRPWTRGFCKLPDGAPRGIPEAPPKPGNMVRYPYMEWAYAYGYSKKYASAGWASYERHFIRWAEKNNYEIDIVTQHDLELEPDLLKRYQSTIFVGHDEYWSSPMRDTVDNYIENGGKVARFAGNFFWQIRLQDQAQKQTCYKYKATELDPVMGTNNQPLLTGAWETAEINRPGAKTFGVNGMRGIYAGLGNCVGRGNGGFTVYRPNHWAFEGTHIGYGDILGADSRIFGYEVDGLDHIIQDGLPFPTGTDGASTEIEILALSPGTNVEADHNIWGETLYIGSDDTAWMAKSRYGEESPKTLDQVSRGNGVIIHWQKGKGEVFTAATCEWVAGLMRGDRSVEQVTKNVLDRFTS